MHAADRIVMAKFRQALEHRAAVIGLDQMKAQQFADRRLRQRAADDGFQETKAIIGFEDIRRYHAVFLVSHVAPRVTDAASLVELLSLYRAGTAELRWRSRQGR